MKKPRPRRKKKKQHLHTTGRLHIDRRAAALAAPAADDDALINTSACAKWLSVSEPWLEIGRSKSFGPPFVQLGPAMIRYRKGDVRAWLAARAFQHTQQYITPPTQIGPNHISRRRAAE